MFRNRKWLGASLAASLWIPSASFAHLTELVITSTTPFAGGVSWGDTGPYEKLVGTAYFEVDPSDPVNAVITDIDKAPRNAKGLVTFSTDIVIVKPVDMDKGNHKVFYRINNRGNDSVLNVQTADQVGSNDIFLKMGYTIADAGWEGDIVPVSTKLVAHLPIATANSGKPISGTMRYEYSDRTIPLTGTFSMNLEGNAAFRSYETTDTDTSHATFVWRDDVDTAPNRIPPDRWAFGTCPTGQASLVPTTTDICYFDGFDNAKLYQLIYTAKNPIVMGLGHATTRDFASFLRYAKKDQKGNPNPLGNDISRVYADGGSQTAGYIRDYIYLGFNEDEKGRRVFDGMIPEYGGTDRVFINVRFADPNTWSDEDDRHDFLQSSYPPFTYAVRKDPLSGITDGVLHRPQTDPVVFQVDSAAEFWQLRGSLNVANGNGKAVIIPHKARLYFNSSTAHGFNTAGLNRTGGTTTPGTSPLCAYTTPGGTSAFESIRALLVVMDEWVEKGIEPPPSNYPQLTDMPQATLVNIKTASKAFPAIPNVTFPTLLNSYDLLDFGPKFGTTGGILTIVPPDLGPSYKEYVPLADADGLDVAGIRPMQTRVPLGTVTGWNVRAPGHRAPNLCGLTGTYVPFANTKDERKDSGDPRLSIEERYHTHQGFVEAVRRAAAELVQERFLLQQDAQDFIRAAQQSDVLKP
jgi:hypothetical protein